MAAQQIAELFGSVGFKIDQQSWKTLDKFENRLDTIKKKINSTFSGKTGGLRGGGGASGGGGQGRGKAGGGGRSSLSLAGSALSNMHTVGMFLTGGILVGSGVNILQTAAKYDALESSMLAATGTAALAKDELKFLEATSRRLGLVTTEIARPFTNFSVAAKENGVAADETRKIFTQFTEASRGLNLTADDTAGVFRALSQMFSKSTVQSEELKGQLGERLPGAYAIAARVMGMTTEEMGKQLKAGKILAKDLVPKLAEEYARLVNDTGSLDKALQSTSFRMGRLAEEWNRFLKRLSDGKTGKALNRILLSLTGFLEKAGKEGGAVDGLASSIAILFEAVMSLGEALAFLATNHSQFTTWLLSIGAVVGLAISPVLALVGGLTLLLLILEDLWGWSQGKDSVIGNMLAGPKEGPKEEDSTFKKVLKGAASFTPQGMVVRRIMSMFGEDPTVFGQGKGTHLGGGMFSMGSFEKEEKGNTYIAEVNVNSGADAADIIPAVQDAASSVTVPSY